MVFDTLVKIQYHRWRSALTGAVSWLRIGPRKTPEKNACSGYSMSHITYHFDRHEQAEVGGMVNFFAKDVGLVL